MIGAYDRICTWFEKDFTEQTGTPNLRGAAMSEVTGTSTTLPRYRSAAGQPNRYSPTEMAEEIHAYFCAQVAQGNPLAITDISIALGMHRDTVHDYVTGEIGRTPELREQYSDVIKWAYTIVENQREKLLMREKGSAAGPIFALKNHHGWRDDRHITVERAETTKLVVELDPNSKLAQRLQASGGVEIIGTCEVVDESA